MRRCFSAEEQLEVEKLRELCSLRVSSKLKGPLWFAVISPPHRITSSPGLASRTDTQTHTHAQRATRPWHTHQPHWEQNYPKEKGYQGVFLSQQRKYCCSRKQSGSQQRAYHGREATFEGQQLKTKSCACRQWEGNKVPTTFNVNRTQLNGCSLDVASCSSNSWWPCARWPAHCSVCTAVALVSLDFCGKGKLLTWEEP